MLNMWAAEAFLHSNVTRVAPSVVNKSGKSSTSLFITLGFIPVHPNGLKAVDGNQGI